MIHEALATQAIALDELLQEACRATCQPPWQQPRPAGSDLDASQQAHFPLGLLLAESPDEPGNHVRQHDRQPFSTSAAVRSVALSAVVFHSPRSGFRCMHYRLSAPAPLVWVAATFPFTPTGNVFRSPFRSGLPRRQPARRRAPRRPPAEAAPSAQQA